MSGNRGIARGASGATGPGGKVNILGGKRKQFLCSLHFELLSQIKGNPVSGITVFI